MNKQIIFITDLFRVSYDIKYYTDTLMWVIFQLFSEQISLSTGQKPSLNLSNDESLFSVAKFYELCGYEHNEESWLKIVSGQITAEAENYFIDSFKDYFLIIYHANPLMLKLFQKHNIPYIDIFEGSVRFLQDLHFCMRSNVLEIYNKLLKYQYPESFIYIEAGQVKAHYKDVGFHNKYNLKPNSLLLIGQLESDLSLLVGNKYIALSDCEEKLKSVVKNYDYIYYKPHPYIRDDSKNLEFIKQFSKFEICNHNFYSLMSTPQITGVAALSSGTLKEAGYFGKNTHALSHLYVDYHINEPEINRDKFVILTNDCYSPSFWSDVLSPCLDTKETLAFKFDNNVNFLRNIYSSWWDYEIGKYAEHQAVNDTNAILFEQVENLRAEVEKNKKEIRKLKAPFRTLRCLWLALYCLKI